MARLKRILAIPADKDVSDEVTLVEQGLDSLMAVEVRSFFLKEVTVDIPVLKILGGSTIKVLLEEVLNAIPATIMDLSNLGAAKAAVSKAPAPVSAAPIPPTPAVGNQSQEDTSSNRSTTDEGSRDEETPADSNSVVAESGSSTPPETPLESPDSLEKQIDASLAARKLLSLEELLKNNATAIIEENPKKAAKETITSMSYGQEGFWFLNDYLVNKKVFNTGVLMKLQGVIKPKQLEEAVRLVSRRHEILRTTYRWQEENGERKAVQVVGGTSSLKFEAKQIAAEEDAHAEFQTMNETTYNFDEGQAGKIALLSLPNNKIHFLLTEVHHIYLDGYSFSLFFKDLETAYNTRRLAPLNATSQYRSFALKQREGYQVGSFDKSIEYYKNKLPNRFDPVSLLPFGKSKTRQAVISYSQNEATIHVNPELATKIRQLARQNISTSFHVYLGALRALMFRLLPEETADLIIGMGDANRGDAQFASTIGFFLNLLPLYFSRPQRQTVGDMVKESREAAFEALQHSQLPFDSLLDALNVPRSSQYTPLFQIFMDYRQVQQNQSKWAGCDLNDKYWHDAATGYDVALQVTEFNEECEINLRLQDTLYSAENTQLLLDMYVNMLENFVAEAAGPVAEVSLWPTQDIEKALTVGRGREFTTEWNHEQTMVHRIDQITELHGDQTALKDGHGNALTYNQMNDRVNSIANALLAANITRGQIVGVFQEPSSDWVCSMLAIFRIGASYLALDQRLSLPRLAAIVSAASPAVIITDDSTTANLSAIGGDEAARIITSDLDKTGALVPNQVQAEDIAVVLFTSGSTGVPKGMKMTHANMAMCTEAIFRVFQKTEDPLVVLQQSPFSFDLSLCEMVVALGNGGTLVVVPSRTRGDPVEVTKLMADEQVTLTIGTPSEYMTWLQYGAENVKKCTSWTYAINGGEVVRSSHVQAFVGTGLPKLQPYNCYGPAEATMITSFFPMKQSLSKRLDPVPVGLSFDGYTYCIVDSKMNPVPLGVPGEIIIGGPAIVAGYLNNDELTNSKFIRDPHHGSAGKVYRSGDRGRLSEDGTLVVEGRMDGDDQIKIRGFRVELPEIERALVKQGAGAISGAIVSLRGEGEDSFLAAHVVLSPEHQSSDRSAVLKSLRRTSLPPYMKPSVFSVVEEIPKTSHSKVDRKAAMKLPLQAMTESEEDVESTLTDNEDSLAELWLKVIPVNPGPLSAESDFFLIGGNSILLVKLQNFIKTTFEASPRLIDLMGAGTLGAMTAVIESSQEAGDIDWEFETQPPQSFQQVRKWKKQTKGNNFTVFITGSTGHLGRNILNALQDNDQVAKVYALVRETSILHRSDKVQFLMGDLAKSKFGLSDQHYDQIATESDVIIHCGANRSFWDKYQTLSAANVDSVKEILTLVAHSGRVIPIHTMSSGSATSYEEAGEAPLRDGNNGYVATKWAADTILRRASDQSDIPIYIHRPTEVAINNSTPEARSAITDQLMDLVGIIGEQPDFAGVTGSIDILPATDIAMPITRAVVLSAGGGHSTDVNVQVIHYEATLRVFVNDFISRMKRTPEYHTLPKTHILEWFGKAKRAGFSWFTTAQELVMGSSEGAIVSKR